MRRRHWYHCSSIDHGDRWVAVRRTPVRPAREEPPVPRLCVCKTIPACFAAVLFLRGPIHVYRTANPRRAVKPRGVWDQFITGERWLIPPVEMVRVATINTLTLRRVQGLIRRFHEQTGQCSDIRLRVAQYAIAVEVLGGEPWERRLLAAWSRSCGFDDPRRYVLECTRQGQAVETAGA
jgi:hypothetical protein